MEEEKKVIIHLKKQDLASDRQEKRKRKRSFFCLSITLFVLWVGFSFGYLWSVRFTNKNTSSFFEKKLSALTHSLSSLWLYKNNYEDFMKTLQEKAYYGVSRFEEDPYTSYLSTKELEAFTSGINMNFVGIGVSYFHNAGAPTITQVFKDSPAEKAGLQVGDVMMKVDGKDISNLDNEQIRKMVIGEEGSRVRILIRREGKQQEVEVIRGKVDTTAFAEKKGDVVFLHIHSFGENTYHEVVRYLNDYQNESKIIIDLRNNGGGYQKAVEDIAGLFLPKGTVMMRQEYADGSRAEFKTSSPIHYRNFQKIVVLINQNTASAAEVLAIALKEQHPNAYLIGSKTYGKGVVQTTIPLSDGSAIKLTTSKWLSPKGVWINKKGVQPDQEVLLDEALSHSYEKYPEKEVFKQDSVSEFVKSAAIALRFIGYDVDRVDGYFSSRIQESLRQFQTKENIEGNGDLNRVTYENLVAGVYRVWNLQKEKDLQLHSALAYFAK